MAKVLDPSTIAANWLSGMQSQKAQANYKSGTANPRRDPIAAAASPEGMQAYANGCAASVTNGRRAAGLAKTSMAAWSQACATKGAARLSTGAQASQAKYTSAMQKWAGVYSQASQAAAAVTGPLAKVQAAMNVLLAAAGKPTV
jgi:hypothetical protein